MKTTVLLLPPAGTVFVSRTGKQVRELDPPKFILGAYRAARRQKWQSGNETIR